LSSNPRPSRRARISRRRGRDPGLLRLLVTRHDPDITTLDLDEIGPLSGGYILSHAGKTIEPGCCGDLGNLEGWERAATESSEGWEMVWIGHPWTFVRPSSELLHFVDRANRRPRTDSPRSSDCRARSFWTPSSVRARSEAI